MSTRKALILGLCIILSPALAFADEEPPACEDGEQVNVTFSDGNNISTMCVNQGSGMVASPDNDGASGASDEGNYD